MQESESRSGVVADGAGDAERPRRPALSPSRALDFKRCPLLYRFRMVDRLPEVPTPAQVRGTLVHAVLERLFDLPAPQRTPEAARALVEPEWRRLAGEIPGLAEALFPTDAGTGTESGSRVPTDGSGPSNAAPDGSRSPTSATSKRPGPTNTTPHGPGPTNTTPHGPGPTSTTDDHSCQANAATDRSRAGEGEAEAAWLASAAALLDAYFALEDPRAVEPQARELLVETVTENGVPLRGYLDRLDVSPGGEVHIVDYKTGPAPRENTEARALFQMKFYALALLRLRGVLPTRLRLVYLGDGQELSYSPEAGELARFGRVLDAIWAAILRAAPGGDFPPNPGPACGWCGHRALCPAWEGVPPPYPGWPAEDPGPSPVAATAEG